MAQIFSQDGKCPDGGTCHHGCADGNCFRVGCCAPLTGAFPSDQWPADLVFSEEKHRAHLEILDAQTG